MTEVTINIYKEAYKRKLRFNQDGLEYTIEVLNSIPLVSTNDSVMTLDKIANSVQLEISKNSVKSLVMEDTETTELSNDELRLLILKDVIADRKAEIAAGEAEVKRRQEIALIEEAIIKKKNSEISNLTQEELEERLQSLRNEAKQ